MTANQNSYKKSSFGPAFFFLGKRRRAALANYYEFCRLMDDIADEPTVQNPQQELVFWQKEVHRLYEGSPETELGQRLAQDVRVFGMLPDRFLLLIEGMQADLSGRRYATEEALEGYLLRVAVIVGRATLDILGVKGAQADALSWQLGCAVQLTNIVRDVADDKKLGRVYLPESLLARQGLSRADVLAANPPTALKKVLAEVAQMAARHYREAFALMKGFSPWKMLPCRVMGYVYLKNLAKIERAGFPLLSPVKLSKREKLQSVFYALFKTFF